MRSCVLFAMWVGLAACGGEDLVDPDELVTIQQGVYGITISGCDTTGCTESAYEGAPLMVTPTGGAAPITMTSDADGFFELELDAGTYELCVHSCIDIEIVAGMRLRRDFVSGPGGGSWCDDDRCGPGN